MHMSWRLYLQQSLAYDFIEIISRMTVSIPEMVAVIIFPT